MFILQLDFYGSRKTRLSATVSLRGARVNLNASTRIGSKPLELSDRPNVRVGCAPRHVRSVPQAAVAVLEARVRPVPATTYRQPRHHRHAFVGGRRALRSGTGYTSSLPQDRQLSTNLAECSLHAYLGNVVENKEETMSREQSLRNGASLMVLGL
jgi:hypothetical protein